MATIFDIPPKEVMDNLELLRQDLDVKIPPKKLGGDLKSMLL